jgi:hypothetical protein
MMGTQIKRGKMNANRKNRLRDIIFKRNAHNRSGNKSTNEGSTNQEQVTFRFSGIGPNGVFYQSIPDSNDNAAAAFGDDIMIREPNHAHLFNDYSTYKFLCNAPGCISVKIAAVRALFIGSSCQGIQVLYKSTFEGGRTQVTDGTENVRLSIRYYGYVREEWIYLDDDELITGLRLDQEAVITGIVFVTNRREIRYGGTRGREDYCVETRQRGMVARPDPVMRIVAFAGTTTRRALQRVGAYYLKPILASASSGAGGVGVRGAGKSGSSDHLSFYFSGTCGLGSTCVTAAQGHAEEMGDNIMRREPNHERTFNDDFALYKALCGRPRCKRVEISSVRVYHHKNIYIQGFEVTYRSFFADGGSTYTTCNRNGFVRGFFALNLPSKDEYSSIDLADGEYITGLDLVQGELISGMAVHTNYRKFHCGAMNGGGALIRIPTPRDSMRVVALAGTSCPEGALQRVGYYSESTGAWATIGPLITLRCLWHQGRAKPTINSKNSTEEQVAVLRAMDLPDGVYALVLHYLVE